MTIEKKLDSEPEALDLIAEIFSKAKDLRSGELSHTDVANWLLDLDKKLHTEPPPPVDAPPVATLGPARSVPASSQDLQEILLAEREGAKIGRDLVEAGSRVIDLLRPVLRGNPEAAAAILSGYVGVLADSMPGTDPKQVLIGIFDAMFATTNGSLNQETANGILQRTLRRLERRGEDTDLDRAMQTYDAEYGRRNS